MVLETGLEFVGSHLRRDGTAPKMGHPVLWLALDGVGRVEESILQGLKPLSSFGAREDQG
jgi:hypothetical protein